MLTFQEKLTIIESFPELQRHNVSLGRVNFHYENSCYDKKNVVYHLHPNGNGFVYAGFLKGYQKDDKDMVNIREYSAEALHELIQASIQSLTADPAALNAEAPKPAPEKQTSQRWISSDNQILTLILEEDLWNLYFGINLEFAFETYEEAEEYLLEEGFTRM
ncbi:MULTISPECIES: hypothetical protein [unclassified Paenibacillus]|uniref:hypothetical protein n=1 Tax=unclassified Paenibacillus TaxID=185978 RepID=UPI00363E1090